jgi:NADPH:quinone reductase
VRVIEVPHFGGPEVLKLVERPDPIAGRGQVVVDAVASDVLYVDTMIRSGQGAEYFAVRPPYIPGNGLGGTIASVGDGVDENWLGRTVVAHTEGPGGGNGYAERAVVSVDDLTAVPEEVETLDAIAVLHDGVTAFRVVEVTEASRRDRVLVLGAAGGMGLLLVQLLSSRGAHVIGAARGRAKLAVIAEAGAHTVVDYDRQGWAQEVLEANHGVGPDLVLDGVGGHIGRDAFEIIARNGRFSAHGAPSGSFAQIEPVRARERRVALTGINDLQLTPTVRSQLIRQVLAEVRNGRMSPLIGQTFPLEQAERAHAAMEARETIAKTLLMIVEQTPSRVGRAGD